MLNFLGRLGKRMDLQAVQVEAKRIVNLTYAKSENGEKVQLGYLVNKVSLNSSEELEKLGQLINS
jgi:hypothetical protein